MICSETMAFLKFSFCFLSLYDIVWFYHLGALFSQVVGDLFVSTCRPGLVKNSC